MKKDPRGNRIGRIVHNEQEAKATAKVFGEGASFACGDRFEVPGTLLFECVCIVKDVCEHLAENLPRMALGGSEAAARLRDSENPMESLDLASAIVESTMGQAMDERTAQAVEILDRLFNCIAAIHAGGLDHAATGLIGLGRLHERWKWSVHAKAAESRYASPKAKRDKHYSKDRPIYVEMFKTEKSKLKDNPENPRTALIAAGHEGTRMKKEELGIKKLSRRSREELLQKYGEFKKKEGLDPRDPDSHPAENLNTSS